ncbi:hypothetical protein SAMN06297251_10159 [Fulvimarina manganoxydans]|uniref:Uncharacterized protein n=1 Tax=Fulvimarina manganoxydans TaxID=937218 RepID=A0A1W1Y906_9HYPH|nr:hypothetical protein [Fulvimarina manganoxydans]SMC32633.1 hypothetical protein SAMN06297251_10159 [Fulvimarina manganoxydans]
MREGMKDVVEETRNRVRSLVEAFAERIRMLIAWLTGGEYVPAPMADRAAAEVGRIEREEVAEEEEDDLPVRRMPILPPSLGNRVRMAADAMRQDRRVGTGLLDPADPEEKRILDWLFRNRLDALDMIASTPASMLQMHVTGERRHPTLPAMDEPQRGVPLDVPEWAALLQRWERERGNSDPDPDRIYKQAKSLARDNYSLEDFITQARRASAASDAA